MQGVYSEIKAIVCDSSDYGKLVSALKQTAIHLKQKGLILQEKYFLNSLLLMHDNSGLAAPEGNLEQSPFVANTEGKAD